MFPLIRHFEKDKSIMMANRSVTAKGEGRTWLQKAIAREFGEGDGILTNPPNNIMKQGNGIKVRNDLTARSPGT